jgi:glycosyltransferase involved in cell wall biosynthesis
MEGVYDEDNYVFCGGINGRDWKTLIRTARLLPDVRFVAIGPQRDSMGDTKPPNIEYLYNVDYRQFQKLIQDCSIVAMPLDTEAPAGLIVLFSAGLMHKPIISTKSYTLREYISSGENGFLIEMGDHVALAERIRELLADNDKRREFGEMLYRKVTEVGSPDVFVSKLINIVEEIDQPQARKNQQTCDDVYHYWRFIYIPGW